MVSLSQKLAQRLNPAAAQPQPVEREVMGLSERWVAYEWCNAFTGNGARNVEGSTAEQWDAVAYGRPPMDLVQAKLACDRDPYCDGFTYDPTKRVFWKLKDIEPTQFRKCKGYRVDVYVKASAARFHIQESAQASAIAAREKLAQARAEEAAVDAANASFRKNLSGNWKGLAAASGLNAGKDSRKEEDFVEVKAPESVTKPAIPFQSVFEGEKPKKVSKPKAKAPIANIFGEIEAPKKKFIGLGADAPSAMLGKGSRSRSRSRGRR